MSMPSRVRITEVGPRDGFQAEEQIIPTEIKLEVIHTLAESGVPEVEVVSFVHPRVIPQMADAEQIMAGLKRREGVRYLALVPNLKGAERALAAGVDGVRLVVCATETYNQRNVGLSVEESLQLFAEIANLCSEDGVEASAVLGAALGCPFEGEVPEERVLELARQFADLGSVRLGIADSAGLANPIQVGRLLRKVRAAVPDTDLWLHLHDTRGLGLANTVAALEAGIDHFDTSAGGLGGCPVIRGATGNVATEDVLFLCREMGVHTGVDLDIVRRASRQLEAFLERSLPSRVLAAGTPEELIARNQAAG